MVEVDGTAPPSRPRCQAIVTGAGVETAPAELGAQGDDPNAHGVGRPARTGVRPAGAWIDRVEPAVPVPTQEPVQVPPADPELGRGGGD